MGIGILSAAMGFLGQQLKAKGDRQELRRVIRQRIIAPNVDRLDQEDVRLEIARDIITAAYATKTMSVLQAIVMFFVKTLLIPDKIKFIKQILDRQYKHIQDSVVIEENEDEFYFRVKKGKKALKRLVRDILTIV